MSAKKSPPSALVAVRLPVKLARAVRAQARRERGTLTGVIVRALCALPEINCK